MQTNFEKLGGAYRQEGDYLLPNIEAPESPQIGIWGQRRLQYLRTSKKVLYRSDISGCRSMPSYVYRRRCTDYCECFVWKSTDLINRHISDPAQHLKVFDPNGVYLATKKIGKNNPKAAEIEADNAARQEWNRTADIALLSGIAEETIIELKNEEIHNEAAESVTNHGWLPELF